MKPSYQLLLNLVMREYLNWYYLEIPPRYDRNLLLYMQSCDDEHFVRFDLTNIGQIVYVPLKYRSLTGMHLFSSNMAVRKEKTQELSSISYEDAILLIVQNISPECFEFKDLEQAIESAILYEEYHGNKQIRDYCSSMITRFKSIKDREDFKFMTESAEDKKVDDYINTLLGIEDDNDAKVKKNQVIIIDLNSANDETVEVISCVLSRLIFEKLKTVKNRNKYPVNLVLEEAHRYISTETGKVFGDANRIFERIAKEGRKYGMFLLVSSQRPSELSKTVLSQCSNFIVHRIQNPEDLSHIRQITPHISETVLRRLPSIPTQHALIFVDIP